MSSEPLRVGVIGARGRMGAEVCRAVEAAPDMEVVAMVDAGDRLFNLADAGAEVVVDFTNPEVVMDNIRFCVDNDIHAVVGTSGFDAQRLGTVAEWLEPKPALQTYQKFLRVHGVDPLKAAMFEDLARNLVVPHELGMTTVLVVPDGAKEVVREDWELEGRDAAYVDHVTDDLTGFLQRLPRG